MKRFLVLFAALTMFFTCSAHAEGDFDLSALSPEELQQLISDAESQLQLSDETMLQSAINLLVDY